MKEKTLGAPGGGIFSFVQGSVKWESLDMSQSWSRERISVSGRGNSKMKAECQETEIVGVGEGSLGN